MKLDGGGVVTYVSPVLPGGPPVGKSATPQSLAPLIEGLVDGLEHSIPAGVTLLSFSGGVADCMWAPPGDWLEYGDIGPLLGPAIRGRFEGRGFSLIRGAETIRATVVGAGAHAMEVSGSTIFYRGVTFPLKNLPVLKLTAEEEGRDAPGLAAAIEEKLGWYADEGGLTQVALALRGEVSPPYRRVRELARGVKEGLRPLTERGLLPVVVVEADLAKTLGQAMYDGGPILCMDGISVAGGDYIDVGDPVAGGTVLPVVVKTLAFEKK